MSDLAFAAIGIVCFCLGFLAGVAWITRVDW